MTLTLTLEREIRKHEDHNDHVVADGAATDAFLTILTPSGPTTVMTRPTY